jgi:hypothetical protein
VYKGNIDEDGTLVAIKVLNLQLRGASNSFIDECGTLRNIRHRNLVRIITSCSSIDIFQGNNFKAKGSLEKWLHPTQETHEIISRSMKFSIQNLLERINIAKPVTHRITGTRHSIVSGLFQTPPRKENLVYGRIPTWRRIDKGRSSLETFMGQFQLEDLFI